MRVLIKPIRYGRIKGQNSVFIGVFAIHCFPCFDIMPADAQLPFPSRQGKRQSKGKVASLLRIRLVAGAVCTVELLGVLAVLKAQAHCVVG